MRGMTRSIKTTSGCSSWARRTPSCPSRASPTTLMSGSSSRKARRPSRTTPWSSTMSTLMPLTRRRRAPRQSVVHAGALPGVLSTRSAADAARLVRAYWPCRTARTVDRAGEARAFVARTDAQHRAEVDLHPGTCGVGVLDDVIQALLDDSKSRLLNRQGQAPLGAIDAQLDNTLCRLCSAAECFLRADRSPSS